MDHYKNKEPPVPVPNLIKKSRGRRVPTEAETDELGSGPSSKTRMFRCDVLGCGKCFLRGEHLKRHIRSIHTHEKRSSSPIVVTSSSASNVIIAYKCVVPSCGKHFSRRDNLVQHLKIHKDLDVSALTSTLPPSPPFSFQDFQTTNGNRSLQWPPLTTLPTRPLHHRHINTKQVLQAWACLYQSHSIPQTTPLTAS
jgi:uncharacterized Zn-finger protein